MDFYFVVSGVVAAGLTTLDLDRKFYVPRNGDGRGRLWAWWWFFVVLNGVLAAFLFLLLHELTPFDGWNPWASALAIGVGYLALIRLKFATFEFQGKETPFGFEAFYEAAKDAVFRRINTIAKASRISEAQAKTKHMSLKELALEARSSVLNDALLSDDEKNRGIEWISKVVSESDDDDTARMTLAIFILSNVQSPA
ncbi:hypothetical protein [Phytoactinopolyspora limicola]|uniref:hypothetical protein n=1 Tax=Phytoactinopolyspora limicola TaxID=2715536 RepID=UPI00140E6AA9|nr:hypothetical protein [Phytoactinopolyspora limicola]